MENQHKKITGYRDLSEEEIRLMNEAKELAEKVGDLVERIEFLGKGEDPKITIDMRWCSIGKTDLQKGFMALIRSVARPTTF